MKKHNWQPKKLYYAYAPQICIHCGAKRQAARGALGGKHFIYADKQGQAWETVPPCEREGDHEMDE